MRTRIFVTLTALMMAMAILPSASASADSGSSGGDDFGASIDGWETGVIPGALIPDGRCPESAGWMLLTAGGGEARGLGSFGYTSEHCAWLTGASPGEFVGKLAGGIMVLTFDDGELTIAYEGSWRFDGDLSVRLVHPMRS